MPKTHSLAVTAGDRPGLLQYALAARLVDEKDERRERRGAPALPAGLTSTKNQRWMMNVLFAPPPTGQDMRLWLKDCQLIVEAIETRFTDEEPPLRELLHNLSATTAPDTTIHGVVDPRFWPALRRLGVSRHPADLVIAAYCGTSHLLGSAEVPPDAEPATERDLRAVERIIKGLALIALGRYPYNRAAMNLLSVLCWWRPEVLTNQLRMATGRRLARALDRATRTNCRVTRADRVGDPVNDARRAFFAEMVGGALRVTKEPHSAASSSSSGLRLARLVLMRHPEPLGGSSRSQAYDGSAVRLIVSRLGQLCRGVDGTTDVVLRREAAMYLLEAEHLVDQVLNEELSAQTPHELRVPALLDRMAKREKDVFSDIKAMREVLEGLRTHALPSWPVTTFTENYDDFARDRRVTVDVWRERALSVDDPPQWLELLDRHLAFERVPRTLAWRNITRQIAVPTVKLLYEALFTPWSARARWVADAFKAAGPPIVMAVSETLEEILKDAVTQPGCELVAKRAAWLLGFLEPNRSSALRVLRDVAIAPATSSDVAADAAWALGDLLAARDEVLARGDIEQCFVKLIERAIESVERTMQPSEARIIVDHLDPGPLVVAQSCFRALSIQSRPAHADFISESFRSFSGLQDTFGKLYDDLRKQPEFKQLGLYQRYLRQINATNHMADWALQRMDADVALTTS